MLIETYKKNCKEYEAQKRAQFEKEEEKRRAIEKFSYNVNDSKSGDNQDFKTAQQQIEYKRALARREKKFKNVPLPCYAPWPNEQEMEALERNPEIKRIFKKKRRIKIKIQVKENEQSFPSSEEDMPEEEGSDCERNLQRKEINYDKHSTNLFDDNLADSETSEEHEYHTSELSSHEEQELLKKKEREAEEEQQKLLAIEEKKKKLENQKEGYQRHVKYDFTRDYTNPEKYQARLLLRQQKEKAFQIYKKKLDAEERKRRQRLGLVEKQKDVQVNALNQMIDTKDINLEEQSNLSRQVTRFMQKPIDEEEEDNCDKKFKDAQDSDLKEHIRNVDQDLEDLLDEEGQEIKAMKTMCVKKKSIDSSPQKQGSKEDQEEKPLDSPHLIEKTVSDSEKQIFVSDSEKQKIVSDSEKQIAVIDSEKQIAVVDLEKESKEHIIYKESPIKIDQDTIKSSSPSETDHKSYTYDSQSKDSKEIKKILIQQNQLQIQKENLPFYRPQMKKGSQFDSFAYVDSLPRDQLIEFQNQGSIYANGPIQQRVRNLELTQVTHYGRFDNQRKMDLDLPHRRNSYGITNKIFFKHHKKQKNMSHTQSNRGHKNYVFKNTFNNQKLKRVKSSYRIGDGLKQKRRMYTTKIRPSTTNVLIKRKKKRKRKKTWKKVKRKPFAFNFTVKGVPLKQPDKPKEYIYKPKHPEIENKVFQKTNSLYKEWPLYEKLIPDPITFDDLLIHDKNFSQRKYKMYRDKGKDYHDLMDLLHTIESIRRLQVELKELIPNTVDQETRTIRAQKIHEYERIYDLVCMNHKILNQKRKKIKPNAFLGKDNKILRDIMYKVNNYEDKMIPSMKPAVLKKLIATTFKGTKETEYAQEHIDHLEELKWNKTVITTNTEVKELQEARHNSILAAHFQRLKKYYNKDEMKKIQGNFNLDDLELGQNKEITYPGTIGYNEDPTQFRCNSRKYKQKPKIPILKAGKEESVYEAGVRLDIEKLWMPYGQKAKRDIKIQGSYLEDIPNINSILKKNIKTWDRTLTMEEMVENAMRKEKMKFNTGEGELKLTKEERLIKFAANFEKNMDKRKKLKENVKKQVKLIGVKVDKFLKEQMQGHQYNFDKDYCFLKMVKDEAQKGN